MLFTYLTSIKCCCFWDVTLLIVLRLPLTSVCGVNVLCPSCCTFCFFTSFWGQISIRPSFFFQITQYLGLEGIWCPGVSGTKYTFLNATEKRPLSAEGTVLSPKYDSMCECLNFELCKYDIVNKLYVANVLSYTQNDKTFSIWMSIRHFLYKCL